LAAWEVGIHYDHDSIVARHDGADTVGMRTQNDYEPRHNREHRVGEFFEKCTAVDL
jgi:hypothetical protein